MMSREVLCFLNLSYKTLPKNICKQQSFFGNKKRYPHLYAVSLSLIAIFFSLQAGKHGLFLNILLFGKRQFPILKQFVCLRPVFQLLLLAKVHIFFVLEISCFLYYLSITLLCCLIRTNSAN